MTLCGRLAALLALLVVVSGCGTDTADVGGGQTGDRTDRSTTSTIGVSSLPDSVTVSVYHPRYLWQERRLAISTINNGAEPVTVTRIALSSDHFVPLPAEPKRSVVAPGARADIQTDFGEVASCNDAARVAAVELDIAVGDGPTRTVVAPLDPAPLDEMVDRECTVLRIEEATDVGFTDWEISGDSLTTSISITRDDTTPIRIERIRGTVIVAMGETSDPSLLPTELDGDLDVPVRLVVSRCDPHAVSQSTRTYEFMIWIGVDGSEPSPLVIDPSAELEETLRKMIAACMEQHADG